MCALHVLYLIFTSNLIAYGHTSFSNYWIFRICARPWELIIRIWWHIIRIFSDKFRSFHSNVYSRCYCHVNFIREIPWTLITPIRRNVLCNIPIGLTCACLKVVLNQWFFSDYCSLINSIGHQIYSLWIIPYTVVGPP